MAKNKNLETLTSMIDQIVELYLNISDTFTDLTMTPDQQVEKRDKLQEKLLSVEEEFKKEVHRIEKMLIRYAENEAIYEFDKLQKFEIVMKNAEAELTIAR